MYQTVSDGVVQDTYNTLEEAQAAMQLLVEKKLPNLVIVVPAI
jgi:hypothetical protein